MTDGDYNNQWSAGGYRVGARAYTTAINGSSSDQAALLCTAMKKKDTVNTSNNVNIEIYTVGFLVSPAASTLLTACATDSSHAILTDTTNGLVAAFQGIAQRVVALYLSK